MARAGMSLSPPWLSDPGRDSASRVHQGEAGMVAFRLRRGQCSHAQPLSRAPEKPLSAPSSCVNSGENVGRLGKMIGFGCSLPGPPRRRRRAWRRRPRGGRPPVGRPLRAAPAHPPSPSWGVVRGRTTEPQRRVGRDCVRACEVVSESRPYCPTPHIPSPPRACVTATRLPSAASPAAAGGWNGAPHPGAGRTRLCPRPRALVADSWSGRAASAAACSP